MTTLIAPRPPQHSTSDRPDLARIDDSEHEIVNGQIVESTPMGVWECCVASTIFARLILAIQGQKVGRVVSETLFILKADPLLRRKPDVAFVSGERWPVRQPPPRGEAAWNVIPDFVVEVISPTDLASEVQGKVAEYLAAGVRLVWVVHHEQMEIYEYKTPRSVRVFGQNDTIDGGDVVPGFRMDLNEVFEVAPTPPVADGA